MLTLCYCMYLLAATSLHESMNAALWQVGLVPRMQLYPGSFSSGVRGAGCCPCAPIRPRSWAAACSIGQDIISDAIIHLQLSVFIVYLASLFLCRYCFCKTILIKKNCVVSLDGSRHDIFSNCSSFLQFIRRNLYLIRYSP